MAQPLVIEEKTDPICQLCNVGMCKREIVLSFEDCHCCDNNHIPAQLKKKEVK